MTTINSNAFTHVGNIRKINEDAILSYPDAGLWAVADGMGGHQAGDYASHCLIKLLTQGCDQYKGNYLIERVRQIIAHAHLAIFDHSQQMENKPVIGTTIVVLALEADNYHCFWSGDSRCYLYRDRELTSITCDHTEAEALLAAGGSTSSLSKSEKAQAENTLTHAIGIDNDDPFLEYATGYLYEGDRFLLCSDGVNKVFSDEELSSRMADSNVESINQELLSDALQTSAPDNLSNIIISLD